MRGFLGSSFLICFLMLALACMIPTMFFGMIVEGANKRLSA